MTKAKLYKLIRRLFSLLAFSIALGYLIYLLKNKLVDFDEVGLLDKLMANTKLVSVVFALMLVNWGIEIVKWRYFVIKFQAISRWDSIKSILGGVISGVITPNRIGELGGRLLYIKKESRSQGIYVNTICSISQTMATLVFGLFAVIYLSSDISKGIGWSVSQLKALALILLLFITFIYFRGNILKSSINFIDSKLNKSRINNIKAYSVFDKLYLLGMSSLRYLVFTIQFVLLLSLFLPIDQLYELAFAVALIFLCTTIIPSGWLSDLAVRTSFSYFILEALAYDGRFGIFASLILWVINLFIPALLGVFVLFELSWFKKVES